MPHQPSHPTIDAPGIVDELHVFLDRYRADGLHQLLDRYPDQTQLAIEYTNIHSFDADLATDLLDEPDTILKHFHTALQTYDAPIDISFDDATVGVHTLPDTYVYHPGGFSPTDEAGHYREIQGEVSKATDVYSRLVTGVFECQRCGTATTIPQGGEEFHEPHECRGCERDGPYDLNLERSEYIDAQTLRVQTPPEHTSGTGQYLDVRLEGDQPDTAAVGDRVTVAGTIRLEQISKGRRRTAKFEPYLDAAHVTLDDASQQALDATSDERDRIQDLADGKEGDPLDVAAASLAPTLYADEKLQQIQRMLVLAMVGGSRIEYTDGSHNRGAFHMLLLGDPGTAKSKLIERVEAVGRRTVGVSGKGATIAGVTASAEQDDFGDASEWTLSAGAFVEANGGLVCIDELDDMPSDVRSAMLEPMSKQTIHISKAGINTTLQARTGVVAAGNPRDGRFDPFTQPQEQFDLEASLLSRFDLIYTLTDQPDKERDERVVGQIAGARDAAKRDMRNLDVPSEDHARIETPVNPEILRKWVALAGQQPAPVFASEKVRGMLESAFADLRGVNGYTEDDAVPVVYRKFEGILRVAEAAAKLEFSDTIQERHAETAMAAFGESIRDYGRDEDGRLDADIQETGASKSQREKIHAVADIIQEKQREHDDGSVPYDDVVDAGIEVGLTERNVEGVIKKLRDKGSVYEPEQGRLKFVGL
jgi:replicative DNA helicase Mcm